MDKNKLKSLRKQYTVSNHFIFRKDEKNNFVRLREIFDNNYKYGVVFHAYIVSILFGNNNIKDLTDRELKLVLSVVNKILYYRKIPMVEKLNHRGYHLSNINQENRYRRNFIRFLKSLSRELNRELSIRQFKLVKA